MTKRQFIWLVIRFFGFAYLFAAVPAILILVNNTWWLIQHYPYQEANTYFSSYILLNQTLAAVATILITVYMLFFGKFVHKVVDKSAVFATQENLDTGNYAEILIRFIGVYFLWGIIARLCVSLYSVAMEMRFKHAPQEFAQLVSKSQDLMQYFKNLHMNLTANSLIGIIILGGLAFYFLKRGKLVIDLFHARWLPGQTQTTMEASTPPVIQSTDDVKQ